MFCGNVPAATNNTTLQRLSNQAGRRHWGWGGLEVRTQTPKWMFTLLLNYYDRDSWKEVMWEIKGFEIKDRVKKMESHHP